MKPAVLYLCINCALDLSEGIKLTKLPTTSPPPTKPQPCEWCRKPRHGDFYCAEDKEAR